MKQKSGILAFALLLGLSGTALAQDAEETPGKVKKSRQQTLTEFYDGYQTKKWEKVEEIYDKVLKKLYERELKKDPSIVLRYADALLQLGKKKKKKIDKAITTLDELINKNPRYIEARIMYAKCLALQKKDIVKIKEQLLESASLGGRVLREINDKQNKRIYGQLLNSPEFILDVMRAPAKNTAVKTAFDSSAIKDIFINPYKPPEKKGPGVVGPGPVKGGAQEKQRAELEAKIDELFKQIEDLIERSEYDNLLDKFKELNGLMVSYEKSGGAQVVQKKLDEWKKRSKDQQFDDVKIALQLQVYVNQGNQILRNMASGLQKDEFDKVFQGFQEITNLVDKMRSEERESFTRNADALFFKAKELNDKAIKKKRIQELKLAVTGIILDPGPSNSDRKSGNSAIINDKIYREGQQVTDPNDEPIAGLKVLSILEGSVKFQYQDTTFLRELTPPPE